ncbi:MFS transporter [Chromobacterium amazonense]|uniref:MFS transporter n=1 Tax=Chromobacterium amazonense TaxID=1382803 RepID=A0ABU8V409_9NEIS|nr:MFS transporter [Chromobacterium amazonense]MDQ4540675.1 MFS transporter [Chromobacterium amazonense]
MSSISNRVQDNRKRDFYKFWLADLTLRLGARVWILAMPIIAIKYLSADSRQIGYLASATSICYLIIGLPAGIWIDRWIKRRVMIVSAIVRALLLATVPLAWLLGVLNFPFLVVVAFLVGATSLFYDIAYQSYLPLLVGADNVYKANSRIETTARAINAVGPVLVGMAMKFLSAPILVIWDALGYLFFVAMLARVPEAERKPEFNKFVKFRQELFYGVKFIWNEKLLRVIALSILLSNFFATIITTLLPILVINYLKLGTVSLGMMITSAECGGLLGAFALNFLRNNFGIDKILISGLIMAAFFTSLVPASIFFSEKWPDISQIILMISLFGTAIGGVIFSISQVSIRQMLCPKESLSRVNSSMRFIVWGTMPIASICAGFGAHKFGFMFILWFAVLGTIITVMPILTISRFLRSYYSAQGVSHA